MSSWGTPVMVVGFVAARIATWIAPALPLGALPVFILGGSLSIVAPVAVYFAMDTRAAVILDDLKTSMARAQRSDHGRTPSRARAKLIGDAIAGLS